LILPVKKNLLIGLGLVNSLNLSEFRATLAHEFGHFSQDAMRVGSYVYMANHIIYDMVYARDTFDELLSSAKRSDARIAILAYIIYAMLWVLRKIMQGAFRLINFFQSALSRQMEFHADLVAVSITGSDSIVHTLKKLSPANSCLHQVFHDLKGASERHLYTQDIYYHHHRALESHPSHYDREQNAKHHYIPSVTDDRSPWLLFRNPEMLRQRVTERFYQKVLERQDVALSPVEQVQKFIDDEHGETTQDARYLGLYDGRLLSIPVEALTNSANDPALVAIKPERIEALLNKLYNAEYKNWLEEHLKRRDELHTLVALVQGEVRLKGNHFEFRGEKRSKSELNTTLQQVDNEVAEGEGWLKEFDNEVFLIHLRIAQIVQEGDYDLYVRYYFQLNLQEILKTAYAEEARLAATYQFVSSKEALSKDEFQQVVTALNVAHNSIAVAYEKARAVALPALQNMQEGIALSEILLPLGLLPPHQEGQSELNQQWANTLVEQILEIKEKGSRLYFKSMGAILSRQEAIARKYRERDGITLL
ncbi:MAG: M48 family metallopeptidase, partial [Armatimonadetes bacterium]|nr:M48 family metallopeptidase [Armatimonadota bacterium]